jgi:hypothetical protein
MCKYDSGGRHDLHCDAQRDRSRRVVNVLSRHIRIRGLVDRHAGKQANRRPNSFGRLRLVKR